VIRNRSGQPVRFGPLVRSGALLAPLAIGLVGRVEAAPPPPPGAVTTAEVEQSIKGGIAYLLKRQQGNGGWGGDTGETALVTLALLTAGESPRSEPMARALALLRNSPQINRAHEIYSVALITMALAAADPVKYRDEIARNAEYLEQCQLGNGAWTYNTGFGRGGGGDNSNTQYALLGLQAASEAGFAVKAEVWRGARRYWELTQGGNGGWGYTPNGTPTGSMTCAGISSLIITGLKRVQGREFLHNGRIERCGEDAISPSLQRGMDWMATNFDVRQNPGSGQWNLYYLYGLERAGRLAGRRFFGNHDWYRDGASVLVRGQNRLEGSWDGQSSKEVNTGFALLFLSKGRAPVLVNKLRHGPGPDWNNDHDDIANLVGVVSRDWKHLLTWQVVDPASATVEDMLQAPIAYFNGHEAPTFSAAGEARLREYVEQGGVIVAEACCGRREFDAGFRAMMLRLFPDSETGLRPLAEDHAIWRAKFRLDASPHPLWGIEQGCRTVVIYSPDDLSCYWNQLEYASANPGVRAAISLGENIVDYITGRELPADKLAIHDVADFKQDPPKRGALRIGKLRHAGEWNIAPLAIPNLTTALRDKLKFDVTINHKELLARDPSLVHYPLVYLHGRASLSFGDEDKEALRRHLSPGGGTLFADAACGSPAFDASFRQFIADLLPTGKLEPIPKIDPFYTRGIGYDLSTTQQTPAAGGKVDYPDLEGVKVDGRWAVIYSKLDIGCSLQKQSGIECRGYTHESATRIATNIVIYSTLP